MSLYKGTQRELEKIVGQEWEVECEEMIQPDYKEWSDDVRDSIVRALDTVGVDVIEYDCGGTFYAIRFEKKDPNRTTPPQAFVDELFDRGDEAIANGMERFGIPFATHEDDQLTAERYFEKQDELRRHILAAVEHFYSKQ